MAVARKMKYPHTPHLPFSVAKWVREKHVQTDEHWMEKEVVPNKLK